MIPKLTDTLDNYKYLFKTNFYITKRQYLILFILTVFSLSASFATIFASLPFLDFILAKSPAEYQKITNHIFSFFSYLNLEPSFTLCSMLLLITVFVKSFADVLYQFYCQKLQYYFMQKEASELNKKIFNMDQYFYFKLSSSKVFNIFTKELERGSEIISKYFTSINAIMQLLIYMSIPFYLNLKVSITFFVFLLVLLIPLLFINYRVLKLGIKTTEITDNHYKVLSNNLNSSKFISIHGLYQNVDKHFKKSFGKYIENKINIYVLGSIIRNYIQPIGIMAIIFSLFFLLESAQLAIIGTILWSLSRTLNPINILLDGVRIVNTEIFALKNLYKTKNDFNEFQLKSGIKKIDKIDEINLQKLDFSYGDKEIFHNLDFKIKKGEKIAIIGETGCGKSTLLDLLTNVLKSKKGKRLINNILYDEIDFFEFRKKISYIPQSLLITDSTVEEFFNFFNEDINKEKIEEYLELMDCKKFFPNIDDIGKVYLGDKGMRLSGGQKQKIILSAALSRKPEVLILDETTNALDVVSENDAIQKLIFNKDLILIFISHKLPTDKFFDKIYRIKNKILHIDNVKN